MRKPTISRLTAALAGGALVLGAAAGVGGAFALWRTADGVTAPVLHWGQEYFAAGLGSSATTAANQTSSTVNGTTVDGTVSLTLNGPALATSLLESDHAAYQLVTIAGLSQGNKGLRYNVASPLTATWPAASSVLGNAGITKAWGRVAAPADCSNTPTFITPAPALPVHLVGAQYSDSITPTVQYWCLVFTGVPNDAGTYDNQAGAVGTPNYGGSSAAPNVTAAPSPSPGGDQWNATVTTGLNPANQADGTVTFGYTTYRVGGQP